MSQGISKISDFGFAKNLEYGENTIMRSIVGTPLYMSPQILNKQTYTNKSDLWSIGLIFYEMIYGSTPWPANNELQLLNSIMTRVVPFDASISDPSKDFIKKCLKIKEEDRMNWEDAFKHPVLLGAHEEAPRGIRLTKELVRSPHDSKENRYMTHQQPPPRSKSQKRITCVQRGQLSKTPNKFIHDTLRSPTPTKTHALRSKNKTSDCHSPWRC
jgi:serine/threonine protein kinase